MDDHALLGDGSPEKEPAMAGQVLSSATAGSIPGVVEISRFCDISSTTAAKGLPSKSEMTMESRASEMGLGCVRGTTLALGFEALTAICIYAVWHLVRLFH